jgi:hypothetical protein
VLHDLFSLPASPAKVAIHPLSLRIGRLSLTDA